MIYSYNLAEEPWIPCRLVDGRFVKLGLRETLIQASDIRELEIAMPLESIGLFRILLALVHSIVNGPTTINELRKIYGAAQLDRGKIEEYFQRWKDRFDLFNESRPFFQTPGLEVLDKDGKPSPLAIETMLFECMNNKTLFDHHSDAKPIMLSPDRAALALIAYQMYALPGLAKKNVNIESIGYQQSFLNAPLLPGIATILIGPNLFETICLNLLVRNDSTPIARMDAEHDIPIWERDPCLIAGRIVPAGYLDYLVPQSRHLRLMPEGDISNIWISSIHLTQGISFDSSYEPLFHRIEDKKEQGRWYPPKLKETKAIWRESAALFAFAELSNDDSRDHRPASFRQFNYIREAYSVRNGTRMARCASFGLLNDQANPILWRSDRFDFPQTLLEEPDMYHALASRLDWADHLGTDLKFAVHEFAKESLGKNPDIADIRNLVNSIGSDQHYWASLEHPFMSTLQSLEDDNRGDKWFNILIEAAREAFSLCVESRSNGGPKHYEAIAKGKNTLEASIAKYTKERKEACG